MKRSGRSSAHELEMHRLDGAIRSLGCTPCPLFDLCGGQTRIGGGWSCATGCNGCDKETCDVVCFGKPAEYCAAVGEVNGFGTADIGPLSQTMAASLPRYIPVLQHEYADGGVLDLPWAAIPLAALLKSSKGILALSADTTEELSRLYSLGAGTRRLLLGTGKDEPSERYWECRRTHGLPERLSRLGWSLAVAPNYSFFLDDPRTQHLHNRKRSLICANEWKDQEIPSVPYFQGVCHRDYRFWADFLIARPEITLIGKEFQTAAPRWERGIWAIEQLAWVQDFVKRDLHPIAVGAAQFRCELARRFKTWTIVDSMPFMKAVNRQRAIRGERRVQWVEAHGVPVASLISANAAVWARWIQDCLEPPPRREHRDPEKHMPNPGQIPLRLLRPLTPDTTNPGDGVGSQFALPI